MKKYLVLGLFILLPFFAKAETQVFGFMNGQFFDVKGDLKYACLGDGNCYDYTTSGMTTLSKILGLSATEPQTITVVTGKPTPPPQPQIVYVPVPTPVPTPSPVPSPTPTSQSSDTTLPIVTAFTYNPAYNPIKVETNEPTTAKLYYLDFNSNEPLQNAYSQSNNNAVLLPILKQEGAKVTDVITDDSLSTIHNFNMYNLVPGDTYFLKLQVTDQSGNINNVYDWSWGKQYKLPTN